MAYPLSKRTIFVIILLLFCSQCKKKKESENSSSQGGVNLLEQNWMSPCYLSDKFKLFLTSERVYLTLKNGTYLRTEMIYSDEICKNQMYNREITGSYKAEKTGVQPIQSIAITISDHTFKIFNKNYLDSQNSRYGKNFKLNTIYSTAEIDQEFVSSIKEKTQYNTFYINDVGLLMFGSPSFTKSKNIINPQYESFVANN